jgi:hypothetical protein
MSKKNQGIVTMPKSLDEARERLVEIESIATATGWERAAIVATFVRIDNADLDVDDQLMSAAAFCSLGIVGLTSSNSVRLYVNRWLDAHDGEYPQRGSKVELPEHRAWEVQRPGGRGFDSLDGARTLIGQIVSKHGTSALDETIKNDPFVAAAAANALVAADMSLVESETLADVTQSTVEEAEKRDKPVVPVVIDNSLSKPYAKLRAQVVRVGTAAQHLSNEAVELMLAADVDDTEALRSSFAGARERLMMLVDAIDTVYGAPADGIDDALAQWSNV